MACSGEALIFYSFWASNKHAFYHLLVKPLPEFRGTGTADKQAFFDGWIGLNLDTAFREDMDTLNGRFMQDILPVHPEKNLRVEDRFQVVERKVEGEMQIVKHMSRFLVANISNNCFFMNIFLIIRRLIANLQQSSGRIIYDIVSNKYLPDKCLQLAKESSFHC